MIETTIIILNWNTAQITKRCVLSIYKYLDRNKFQVVIVDNASTDNSISVFNTLISKYRNLQVIKNTSNLGFSIGNNSAKKFYTTKYLVFLNSDIELLDDSISTAIDYLKMNPDVGIVAPKLILTDGKIQPSVFPPQTLKNAIKEFLFRKKNSFSPYVPNTNKAIDVNSVVGAAIIIKTNLFKKIGMWNEKYFMYFEDLDLCRKIRSLNKRIIYFPLCTLLHKHGASGNNLSKSQDQWRRLIPSSKKYHGIIKHYLINLIILLSKKTFSYKIFPLLFFFFLTFVFYYKVFIKNLIPFPADMLVGAYYPWLDSKWGNIVGVVIKNPIISDVFSQIFLWKELLIKSIKSFQWPLWNPYSYSGYPLLANFQSSVFNPINIFFLIFGMINGWSANIISQTILCLLTSYIYLKQIKRSNIASIIGSLTYAFCGFNIVWLQYSTVGFAMAWIPFLLFIIDNYFETRNQKKILIIPVAMFLLMSSGHFQSLVYGLLTSILYTIFKLKTSLNNKNIKLGTLFLMFLLGIGFMAIQIIPTLELFSFSIRTTDNNINSQNFGLIPYKNLITLFAPDFFGNPTTYNYWGVHNYNETIMYVGIASYIALIFFTLNRKSNLHLKFFYYLSLVSLIFSIDNPIARTPYLLKVPFISTSYASRNILIFSLSNSILTAFFIDHIKTIKTKKILITLIFSLFIPCLIYLKIEDINKLVAHRNLILPLLTFFTSAIILLFYKKYIFLKYFLILIIIFDLFRFGWKYTPFVNKIYMYPQTDITNFLQKQPGIFRIDKESGPLMPSNTWSAYNLYCTSGYDPLALYHYTKYYNTTINQIDGTPSRYSTLDNYNAQILGQNNVKYLLALKYNEVMKIEPDGQIINSKINTQDWKFLFESGSVKVFENQKFQPRAKLYSLDSNQASDKIDIINYQDNSLDIQYQTNFPSRLEIADTWMPGWYAQINNQVYPVNKSPNNIHRSIVVPSGNNIVHMFYYPNSFHIGLTITLISSLVYFVFALKFIKKKYT